MWTFSKMYKPKHGRDEIETNFKQWIFAILSSLRVTLPKK